MGRKCEKSVLDVKSKRIGGRPTLNFGGDFSLTELICRAGGQQRRSSKGGDVFDTLLKRRHGPRGVRKR